MPDRFTCGLCWLAFESIEDLWDHEAMEEHVAWSLDTDNDHSEAVLN